jgi:ABC-type branched-subunit amino acid transport system substrate-binding protein
MGRRTRSLAALLLALALVAAACSSDREDEAVATDETTTTAAPADDGDDSGGGDGGEGETFGDLPSPCGEAEEDNTDAGDEQGVTTDQVVIGYGDDAGFPTSPGLSQETSHAMEAFIEWCNGQGGIHGREIAGRYYDAKITEVGNAMTQACADVFMLVGQAWALDVAQEETRIGCGLPTVPTYAVSADFANAPLAFQPVPNPIDLVTAAFADQMARLYPEEVKKTATLFGDFAATIDTKDKVVAAYPKFGMEFFCPQQYPIGGTADWKPFVQKLKDCGAEVVYFSGQAFPNLQNILDAAAQLDYRPVWMTDANNYLESFAQWNTNGNGDLVHVRTAFTPFELAETNPATQQYVEASAFLLWATAAKECGAELTRQCVLDELAEIESWTGGGLHAETNPAKNLPTECGMVLKLEGAAWVQAAPEDEGEFDCSPDYVVEISGRVVDQAELGPDRISTKYTG